MSSPTSWCPTSSCSAPGSARGSKSSGRPWARWTERPPPPTWPPGGRLWSSLPTAPSSSGDEVERGCGPSPGSPCRGTGPRCSPSTSPSTTTCGAGASPARSSATCRTSARSPGSTSPTGSSCTWSGLDDLEPMSEAIGREVLAARSPPRPRRTPVPGRRRDRGRRYGPRGHHLGGQGVSDGDRRRTSGRRALRAGRRPRNRGTEGGGGADVGPHRGPRHRARPPAPARRGRGRAGPTRMVVGHLRRIPPGAGRGRVAAGHDRRGCTAQWSGTVAVTPTATP